MEESKIVELHTNLLKLKKSAGLGASSRFNFGNSSTNTSTVTDKSGKVARADGLPNNGLYANFRREGSWKKGSAASKYGDGRAIKRNFDDCKAGDQSDNSSTKLGRDKKRKKKAEQKAERKAERKAEKFNAKKQARLLEKIKKKREAKRLVISLNQSDLPVRENDDKGDSKRIPKAEQKAKQKAERKAEKLEAKRQAKILEKIKKKREVK